MLFNYTEGGVSLMQRSSVRVGVPVVCGIPSSESKLSLRWVEH